MGGNPLQLDEISERILVNKPNTSLSIGWKWAQREDAEWMLNDFIVSENTIWGPTKQSIRGDTID